MFVDHMAKNKFEEIARRLLPRRIRNVDYSKPPAQLGVIRGRYIYDTDTLQAPKPIDPQSLWDFLHECAHANFHWDRPIFNKVPQHVTEYECEQWTWDRFVEEGISDGMREQSSVYVRGEIRMNFPMLHKHGLDQRALDYLLEADRNE